MTICGGSMKKFHIDDFMSCKIFKKCSVNNSNLSGAPRSGQIIDIYGNEIFLLNE